MSRYICLHRTIWNDDKFPFLNTDTQIVVFHLFTTYYGNPLGLFKASTGALADEIRWKRKRYEDAIRDAISYGILDACEKHQMVYIKNFLKYNPPTSPKSYKKWNTMIKSLPECRLKNQWYQDFTENKHGISDGIWHAILDAISIPSGMGPPIQEQEQEQYQEKEKENVKRKNHAIPDAKNSLPIVEQTSCSTPQSIKIIFEYWKEILDHPKAILDNKRKSLIRNALKLYKGDPEPLKQAILGCSKSKWHMGNHPKNHKKVDDLGLILRDASYIEKFMHIAEHPENSKSIDDVIVDEITGT